MRAPAPDLRALGLARLTDLPNTDAGVLPGVRRVWPADDLPLAGLIDQAIPELQIHRQDPGRPARGWQR